MNKTILIIEDELKIRFLLRDYLKAEGFSVLEACDGDEGLFTFKNNKVDLILLDIMMPKVDGITVLETIREVSDLPVILLTAKGQEEDKLFGYEVGADDYITKPFSPKILIAKIKALLKRTNDYNDNNVEQNYNGLIINKLAHEVKVNDEHLKNENFISIIFDVFHFDISGRYSNDEQ